jgi:hypothetical protein
LSADESPPRAARRTHWLVWAFALFGALGLLAMIFLAFAVNDLGRPYQPAKVAGDAPETVFTLRNVHELTGTSLLQIDIAVSESNRGSSPYSGGRAEDTRNILLLDKATGASRKLLPDNNRRIDETRYLSAEGGVYDTDGGRLIGASEEQKAPLVYYLLSVRQAGDKDVDDVLVGTLSSGKQAYVMRGIDGIDSIWMHSATQIGMIVRDRLSLYYRIVDIPSLKLVQSKRIDIG